MVKIVPKIFAVLMSIRTMEAVIALSTKIEGSSDIFNVRRMKRDTNNAYATATAAASVGVKTPLRIPPKMSIGIMSASAAFLKLIRNSFNETEVWYRG